MSHVHCKPKGDPSGLWALPPSPGPRQAPEPHRGSEPRFPFSPASRASPPEATSRYWDRWAVRNPRGNESVGRAAKNGVSTPWGSALVSTVSACSGPALPSRLGGRELSVPLAALAITTTIEWAFCFVLNRCSPASLFRKNQLFGVCSNTGTCV